MKRIVSFICLISLLAMSLSSCALFGAEEHEHAFAQEWKSDSDYHWHACTVDSACKEQGERALHDFEVDLDGEGGSVNKCKTCGYTNNRVSTAPEHEHTFGTEYEFGDNFHWYECTVDGCFETSKSREHQYGSPEADYADGRLTVTYTCVDCGFQRSDVAVIDAEVESATEWDSLFGNFNLTNFEMDVYIDFRGEKQHNHCIVIEDGLYYNYASSYHEMYIKKEDGQWVGYSKGYLDEEEYSPTFERIDRTQQELEEMCNNYTRETIIQISFAENFDKFTYNSDDGSYTSDQEIVAIYYDNDGTVAGEVYCFNSVVKVADGKILSIDSEYYFPEEDDGTEYRFVYHNIGISEFSIPQYVIDEANSSAD